MNEGCIITTVYIYGRQLLWMEEKKKNRSEFIRHAIDLAIDEESGSARRLKSLIQRQTELTTELRRIEEDISKLAEAKTTEELSSLTTEIRSKLTREIRFGVGPSPDKLLEYLVNAGYDPMDLSEIDTASLIRECLKECLGVDPLDK